MSNPFSEVWTAITYWFSGQRDPESLAWDERWGTESAAFTVWGYEPTHPSVINEALDALGIPEAEWSFVDLGSGKGRAVLIASRRGFRRAVGIEHDPRLHRIAEANLAAFTERDGPRCPVALLHGDAALEPLPAGPLVVYLFNPFPPGVMREVLDRLRDREHRVVYVNPLDASVVESEGFVERARGGPEGDVRHWRIYTT